MDIPKKIKNRRNRYTKKKPKNRENGYTKEIKIRKTELTKQSETNYFVQREWIHKINKVRMKSVYKINKDQRKWICLYPKKNKEQRKWICLYQKKNKEQRKQIYKIN